MVFSQSRSTTIRSLSACDQRAWVEIDLAALTHNVQALKSLLRPGVRLMAVVKADAYGHGVSAIAQTAQQAGAAAFAVATTQEGIELRQAGIKAPILVLGAIHRVDEIAQLTVHDLQPTLCTPRHALHFSEVLTRFGRNLPVHLNIDTGMSRLGTWWPEALEFVRFVTQLPHLDIASVYSHFATADESDPQFMIAQHTRFEQLIAQLREQNLCPNCLHLANSAGTLSNAAYHYDQVRVGLALYGLSPAPHLRDRVALKPVMRVKARITQVKTIPPGTGVSYGHRFVSDQETPIAVVGIGYADGVPRLLSQKMAVLLREQRVRQIGAITMDQLMIDVSACPDVQPGDVVTLIGQEGDEHITADDWAGAIGSIAWEILCGFKQRLPRVYYKEG
jgi:alanine racemase